MTERKSPGALASARGRETISREMLPHTIGHPLPQCRQIPVIVAWRVGRFLNIETVEVRHVGE